MRSSLLCILLIAGFTGPSAFAQEFQYWIDASHEHFFHRRAGFSGDWGARTSLEGQQWNLYYFRPAVRFRGREGDSFFAGMALFHTLSTGSPDHLEIRPWQGYSISFLRIGLHVFNHYFRLEERIGFSEGTKHLRIRARYNLSMRIPVTQLGENRHTLSVTPGGELFAYASANPDNRHLGQTRIFLEMNIDLGQHTGLGLNYTRLAKKTSRQEPFNPPVSVVRLRFSHQITSPGGRESS